MKVSARVLSVFLAICFLAGLLPAEALAEWTDSDGTEPAPPIEDITFDEPAESQPDEEPPETVPALYAEVASGTCGDNLTWVLDEEGTLTISGTGKMENYSYDDVPWYQNRFSIRTAVIRDGVTSIGNSAFEGCIWLAGVTIPGSVASIGNYVFEDCSRLTNVVMPEGVTSIGKWVFYGCSSLTSVTIPEGVTYIGDSAFKYCSSLTNVVIPEGVISIGDSAFCRCSGLTSVTIPESVTSIGDSAFEYCSKLTNVAIPKGVISIGNSAFSSCSGLTSVTIPESVTSIGNSAFSSCSGLTSVTIPESVTSIGNYAFSACKGLTSVRIPEGVTYIGQGAFSYCNGLSSVRIPGDVPSIGWWAFSGCPGLTSVIIPEGVASIGDRTFSGCSGLTSVTIPESVTSIGEEAFSDCSGLTDVTIPEGVASIGYKAFYYCSGLSSATIPESVTSIGGGAFYGCNGLSRVIIPEGVTSIEWSTFSDCGGLTSVTIPESVTSIGDYAFSRCGSLTSVTIPEGVTSIGKYAFSRCSSLPSATIPESVTSIGEEAFSDCSGLTGLTIPKSVTSIGKGAFRGCSGLPSVKIPEDVPSVGWWAFSGCPGLTSVIIPAGVTSIGSSTFSGCSGLISVTIPESMTSIGNNAFSGCMELTSLTIPESVISIGNSAFRDCRGLTSMAIPESITSIGDYVFHGCSGLTSVTVPEGVTSIGNNAFYGCRGLISVTIPESVTSIGDGVFSGCSGLTSVTIPEGVTSIGNSAFSGCSRLTSMTIPESVTSIGNGAFSGCSGLTGMIIPEGVTSIGSSVFSGCAGLTSMTIPENVTSIGDYAFSNCSELTSVTIPEGVTSIGDNTFSGCIGLTSVAIPESISSIGDYVFHGCSGLTSVTIPEGVTSIGNNAFASCTGLTSVTIPDSVTSIGYGAFYNCWKLPNVTIPESVASIGNGAFWGCSGLTSVTIPENVTSIGSDAFKDCSPDLYIYCYPGSYAMTYAIENNLNYALLGVEDDEVFTWLTSNAPSGVVAGTEFLIRTGFSAQKPASTLQIDLPQGLALSKSTIWLDGKELTAGSYTLANGSLTVSLTGLPSKPAHTLYLYSTATVAGSYSVRGTLTLLSGEEHSLGITVIRADQARLNVPEKVGYISGIIATGKANPGCGVTLLVDGANAGQTTTNDAGSWQISFNLGNDAVSGSSHTVYAEIQLANGQTVKTAEAAVIYQACAVNPVKVTMYNTGDHGAQETVFDFTKPEEAKLVRYYRIWPSRFPSFTFKAEFSGDPSTLSGVSILTTDSAGNETTIPAVYDKISRSWVGTCDYTSFQDAPVWVRVVYSAEEISSNKLSAVPIMDPSGYVYEAVPSNRLAGVKATVFSDQDGNTPWNAHAFDQVNPQVTGADGSYYWDVPAGNWKVSFTKDGYENTATDWLTVPPPQVDINLPMVSTAAPEVKCAAVYEDYAEITFSQYMNISSVKSAITLNGTAAAVEALDAEYNADKTTQYATRFRAATTILSGQVALAVDAASNYAGRAMPKDYTQTFSVETRPTEIAAPETVSMEMSAGQNIRATLVPSVAGRILTIENLTPAIIDISETSAITNGNGVAEIPVEALLPGTGILRIAEPISGLEATVSVQVKAGVEPEISIDASIIGSVLNYRISNVPEELGAKLIVASYINQQMGKAVVAEKLSGTMEINNLSATSYVLFLVESGTWRPLCPNVTVPLGTGTGA